MKYNLVPVVKALDLEILLSEKANIDVDEIRSLLFMTNMKTILIKNYILRTMNPQMVGTQPPYK